MLLIGIRIKISIPVRIGLELLLLRLLRRITLIRTPTSHVLLHVERHSIPSILIEEQGIDMRNWLLIEVRI